ncbi:MAG: acyl-CoA dehydrogenase [Deltaproteobacteria bacterium]|nr:acyl-CoA dehydrogenase [Deltaproteobacteria bacterium]
MAQVIADRRDMDFVLYEQMNAQDLAKEEKFAGLNKKAFDIILSEARNFALKEILPTRVDGDRIGVRLENGRVRVPESYHRAHKLFLEGEWTSMTEAPEFGGQGMPHIIARAASEYLVGANGTLTGYAMMGHGTGKMIELYGTLDQKNLFLNKLYTGKWGGTMLLTESNAGSDVGALTTTAVKNPDGSYTLTGNKIFITNGEHDLAENIIHPVLARVEGAPEGTRGISIFIVPKIRVRADGSLGEPNDVVCTGIEEKMGIHGSATCSMALGGSGKCRGFLLGEENQGMKIMFHMMNEARLDVGFQGLNAGSSAYLYALDYARQRLQGRDLAAGKDPDAPQVPIIRHPDVRRMLLWMKAHVEGMRSLIYYVCGLFDQMACTGDPQLRQQCNDMAELLTPVIKAYCSERGFEACIQAIQVYGGYGYIREYPVEQLARDCKIASLYEGTNGIQAMDLLGRKLGLQKGMIFKFFIQQIQKTISSAKETKGVEELATETEAAVNRLAEIARHLGQTAASSRFAAAFAHAHPFLEVMGDTIMAWMLLWRAQLAASALNKGASKKDAAFYEGQMKSAEFFINSVLPITLGKMNAIFRTNGAAVDIPDAAFGGQ